MPLANQPQPDETHTLHPQYQLVFMACRGFVKPSSATLLSTVSPLRQIETVCAGIPGGVYLVIHIDTIIHTDTLIFSADGVHSHNRIAMPSRSVVLN